MEQWAILQLRDGLDPIPVIELERDLRARWPKIICRFPAVKQGQLDRDNPLSSYIFVQTPVSPKIEDSQFVARFLRDPASRKLQKVSDAELAGMIPPLDLPPTGACVRVTAGDWSGLEGTVVDANCATIKVLVELWSKQAVLTLAPNEFQTA